MSSASLQPHVFSFSLLSFRGTDIVLELVPHKFRDGRIRIHPANSKIKLRIDWQAIQHRTDALRQKVADILDAMGLKEAAP